MTASRTGPGKAWVIDGAELARVFSAPDHEARAELVKALARMVNHVIESGKGGMQPAIDQLALIRTTLADVANIDDFLADLDAAERALLAYPTA